MQNKRILKEFNLEPNESWIDTNIHSQRARQLAKKFILEIIRTEPETNLDECGEAIFKDLGRLEDRQKGFPVSAFIEAEILARLNQDLNAKHYQIIVNPV